MNSALPESAALDQVYEIGGGELMASLIATFCERRPEDLAAIASAAQGLDFGELRKAAHRLKGSCRALGARPAADLCLYLEMAARENRSEGLAAMVDKLEKELVHVERALKSLLAQRTKQ